MSAFAAFIDMKKDFDWVDGYLLLFKISSQFDIKGKIYNFIAYFYSKSTTYVKIDNYKTTIFDITSATTLFSMFINDLAVAVKNLNRGVDAGMNVSILLYADYIFLIAIRIY